MLVLAAGIAGLFALGTAPAAGAAGAPSGWHRLTYDGEQFSVPASWPVQDLQSSPTTCVRFDRHAVYEGAGGSQALCPPNLAGVTEAVQVAPLPAGWQSQLGPLRSGTVNGQTAYFPADMAVAHRLVAVLPAAGLQVTVSYGAGAAVAQQVFNSFTATGTSSAAPQSQPSSEGGVQVGGPVASSASPSVLAPGPVIDIGKGFDACGAPSETQMAAWHRYSPYQAAGIYIGGVNRACSQQNLTSGWVSREVTAGWRLFPLYVGLQPSCALQSGLQSFPTNLSQASADGAAAAGDAASHARALGLGSGSPIFYDMEAWQTSNSSCSKSVVAFIKAWTARLHVDGFRSGMYGSADAGLRQDIAPIYGHANAPDLLDFGEWDGQANANSSYIPSGDWPGRRRIKQYNGNLTQTYGGVTLGIDQDYVYSTVVGLADPPRPTVTGVSPRQAAVGTTVTVTGSGFQPGATTVNFGAVHSGHVTVDSSTKLTASVPARGIRTLDVTVSTRGGTSATATADRFTYVPIVGAAMDPRTGGYWLTTPKGNVFNFDAPFEGSTRRLHVVGIAPDPATGGYWLATSVGNVYGFHAPWYGDLSKNRLPAPVVSITATTSGYLLTTSKGNVYNFHTPWYGSPAWRTLPGPVVGTSSYGNHYAVTTTKGNIYNFGVPWHGSTADQALPHPIAGIGVDPSTGGYRLAGTRGDVYNFGVRGYGSKAGAPLSADVTAIKTDGHGYLLVTQAGNVYNFNAAWHGSPAANG